MAAVAVATLPVQPGALHGRVLLLVGAHGALGSAVAKAAAAAGATVVLLGRRLPKLTRLYDALVAAGAPTPAIYPLDLEGAGPADYEQLAAAIERECGRLDAVVHLAADFKHLAAFESIPAEDWVRGLHVNLTAPLLLTQACLPLLRQRDDAAVVVLLDHPERVERAHWGAYGVAQAGRHGWVKLLADELEHSPVRVLGLRPGPMRGGLRSKAFFSEDAGQWPGAEAYAPAVLAAVAAAAELPARGIIDLAA